ncbi:MAG: alanine racemase [Oligoflexia bacterium]|nr:alanine racemase [Oligoflexia bacterium]
MKKRYESPTLTRQVGGVTNKFGLGLGGKAHDRIDGVSITELRERYGSPLFIYSERTLKEKHRELQDAFSHRYPRFRHAWSYKTNYLKAICRSFQRLGSWAEVVSMMEYEMARSLGVPGRQIVFNGPYKPYESLKRALGDEAIVNIDSFDELEDVERIAGELGRTVKIGLRFNMSLGAQMSWDRYGFNLESGAAAEAIERAQSSGRVTVAGYHAHLGTFVYDPEHYRTAAVKLVDFHGTMKTKYGVRLEYLDLGGGFASRNRLRGSYLSTADLTPSFERYAEAICEPLLAGFAPAEAPLLILETGRAMVDEAGSLVSTVISTKRLNNGKRGVVLDAGVNLLFTAFWYDHEVLPVIERSGPPEDQVLYGPLCMQIDVVREQLRLPRLERGDPVLIRPVGAYNNTQWLQFITLRPNIVMVGENGEVSLIRERETVEYLQQREVLPPWLRD